MGLLDSILGGEGASNIGSGFGRALQTFQYIIAGILIFVVVSSLIGFFVYRRKQKKSYNIPLVIITPRSDGRITEINTGVGGYFKNKKVGGVTSFRVKRRGIGIVDIPPPPSIFLTAPDRTLILAQKGMDDYEPVLPDSLNRVITSDGKRTPILNLKAKNQDATAWAFDNEEAAKRRFTFSSVWEKYQVLITLMTFIFILFLILYINWIGMKDVVAGLAQVADALKGVNKPIITSGG